MSKIEKLLHRLRRLPKDFTWDELVTLMISQGFELHETGGSNRKFIHIHTGYPFCIHEPHPGKILKPYAVRAALKALAEIKEC